jgi:hypothetical protein
MDKPCVRCPALQQGAIIIFAIPNTEAKDHMEGKKDATANELK